LTADKPITTTGELAFLTLFPLSILGRQIGRYPDMAAKVEKLK